ncbi:MAG: OmpA family protein [Acidobacteria bacterium]|nr:OmpA family protein [Acidobacteriota bacterium]
MNRQTSNPLVGIAVATAITVLFAGGCASKKYVADGLSSQDVKLSDIESQVEKNQRGLRDTGKQVDKAARAARAAQSASEEAGTRADEAYRLAEGKLLYKVILSDKAGHFAFESDALADEAKASLDDLATRLKKDNVSVYLEIEGHTDSSGPEPYNMQLGLRRAEAVRRYLNSEQGVPLHRMSVISYGESRPAADNGTREGRAANRRVEIRVLS